MRKIALLLAWASFAWSGIATAESEFSFGVTASAHADDAELQGIFKRSASANLAFLVAQGIKHVEQPCSDSIYERRKRTLDASKHGLIVGLSGSDWSACGSERALGSSAALGKLTRVREIFFVDDFSYGATKLPLVMQSTEDKFHTFVENVRWEIREVMFATINLPANNNHFVSAAGRNGEFEDRLVANREWLRRVFTHAALKKLEAVVLFSDGNPMARTPGVQRDGFAETRRHLLKLASNFKGKVLIVHAQGKAGRPAIRWRGNVGLLGVTHDWIQIGFNSASKVPFAPILGAEQRN